MNFFTQDIVGAIAAILSTSAFVPQVLQTVSTRDVSGISLTMYSVFMLGVLLWLIYGIMAGALPIIIANVVTGCLAGIVLFLKIKGRKG